MSLCFLLHLVAHGVRLRLKLLLPERNGVVGPETLPSARKRLQMKIRTSYSLSLSCSGEEKKFPQIFLAFAFVMNHVGHTQATTTGHTYNIN